MTHPDDLEIAPEQQLAEPAKRSFWTKLKKGLFMTHTEILERVDAALEGRATFDEEVLEYLEESLIASDLGVETALELVESIRSRARAGQGHDVVTLRKMLEDEIAILLLDAPQPPPPPSGPLFTLVVGVNGVGKTTSIAKLARRDQMAGHRVLIAAADTFRAAAIDQLALWGERIGVDVIKHQPGADPGAVIYDAIHAARARGADRIYADTAGRLHNKKHLMAELEKIDRVVRREAGDWTRRTLLVLDATTGHNALAQAREFTKVVAADGVLLAKLDGTAKGGMAVAVARDLRLPVLFLGVGESPEDLVEFHPRAFASALVGS